MTLDMEVPLMPMYVGGAHPLKLLGSMAAHPSMTAPSPPRTDSRSSRSSVSPAQPAPPRTGFSIADILKPNFGQGHPDDHHEESDDDVDVEDKEDVSRNKDQSVFKSEPLKDRLKLPEGKLESPDAKGRLNSAFGTRFPMTHDVKISGLVAPKPTHGLPTDISPAYYQSYYHLYHQKYADYVQFYGQPGILPFPLASPPHGSQPMKNPLQLAHEQLLAKQQGRGYPFPAALPTLPPHPEHHHGVPTHPFRHSYQSSIGLEHKDSSPSPVHRGQPRSPVTSTAYLSEPGSRDLRTSPVASSTPSPVPHHHEHARDRSPALTTPSKSACSPQLHPGASSESSRFPPVQSPDSTSRDSGSPQGDDKDENLWPAWVYCTRYSDRPSSGPRSRKMRRKDGKNPDEKRPRTAFTNDQLDYLRQEFDGNKYLTEERRQRLAKELSLTESQIKIWFQNKRAKLKKSSPGGKNSLALSLMAQGLYKHTAEGDDSSSQKDD